MQLTIPIALSCDILVIGGERQACRLAQQLSSAGRRVLLCASENHLSLSDIPQGFSPAEALFRQEEELRTAGVHFYYGFFGVAPAVTTGSRLSGYLFVTRGGYMVINAKCIADFRTSPAIHPSYANLFYTPGEPQLPALLSASGHEVLQLTTDDVAIAMGTGDSAFVPAWMHTPEIPFLRSCRKIYVETNSITPTEECDVMIIGGGDAGCTAAVSAARHGARVLLAESSDRLGDAGSEYSPEQLTALLTRSGVTLRMHCAFAGVLLDNRRCSGAVLASSTGRLDYISAGCVVDATGRAAAARAAGVRMQESDGDDALTTPGSASAITWDLDHEASTEAVVACSDDPFDCTRAFTELHARFRKAFQPPEKLRLPEQSRIVGDLLIQPQDIFMRRSYRDTIARFHGAFSSRHGLTHPLFLLQAPEALLHDIRLPLRALLPLKLEGLIVIDSGLSCHRDCLQALCSTAARRRIATSAGCAAALSATTRTPLRQLPIDCLQKQLVDEGVLSAETLTENEGAAGPVSPSSLSGTLSAIFFRPDIARRRLQADFEKKPDLMTASVLAFLGDASGRSFVQNAIAKANWNNGWEFTEPQSHPTAVKSSPLEALLFALRTIGGSPTAAYTQLTTLTAQHKLSHLRALALYFIRWPSSAAAKDWERLINDLGGRHSTLPRYQELPSNRRGVCEELNDHLKRLYSSAALFACQPLSLIARQMLEMYRDCPYHHLAVFAKKILRGG